MISCFIVFYLFVLICRLVVLVWFVGVFDLGLFVDSVWVLLFSDLVFLFDSVFG